MSREPPAQPRSFEHRFVLAACLAAPLAWLALGLWLDPDPRGYGTHEQLGFETCWMVTHTGLPCPGCGVTTALALAAHGRPLAALATQPFGALLALLCCAAALWAPLAARRGRDLWRDLSRVLTRRWLAALGLACLAAWAYKAARMRWG